LSPFLKPPNQVSANPNVYASRVDLQGGKIKSLLKNSFFRLIKNARMQGARNPEE